MKLDAVATLVEEIKRLYATPGSAAGSATEAAARLLRQGSPALRAALQADRDGALALIGLLSAGGQQAALANLLSNLEIARDDRPMLEAAIHGGLGGAPWTTHQWLVDYDVPAQRVEMIRTCVLPYIAALPGKQLFGALKVYEAQAIAANRPLLDGEAIDALLSAARGAPMPSAEAVPAAVQGRGPVRLLMPNETFNVLLRLAWRAPEFLLELHERHGPATLLDEVAKLGNIVPVYLIPTHLGYPMGGGESFMHQTCRILSEFGVQCVWVSYLDPATGWYQRESVTHTPYYVDVRRAGGCSQEAIQREVDFFGPDLIHAHGGTNDVTMAIAADSRINTMVGYHFWNGLVQLGETGNRHIMDNLVTHCLVPPQFLQSSLIWKYVASEFMQKVHLALGGKEKLNVIHAVSDAAQYLSPPADDARFVLQINVCPLKGGTIFKECVEALGARVPFMGVKSEADGSGFFDELDAVVARHPQSVLHSYGNVRDFYRTARMVIVPTLVDETFCRVAFEAAMNGIPVICTANGYLPQMLGESGIFRSEDAADWIETIGQLYDDTERLKRIGAAQKAHLEANFGSDFRSFIQPAMGMIDQAATRSIGLFTMWGDIGLGNLCHAYARLLRSAGYRVHVFSFQPYSSIGKGLVRQNDPSSWTAPEHADSVHYSYNCREEVTVYELSQFVLSNQIHTLLVPEVCWMPNWNRLFALNIPKLAICSIPMIEIVIDEEIAHHNRLSATLYCTRLAERVLRGRGVHNGAFLGHGFGRPLPAPRVAAKRDRLAARDKIRFLHVAGHNPTSRKNTPQILDAFIGALALRDDIELTVTSMDPLPSYYNKPLPPGITIIDRSIGHGELLGLYEEHDISIQVSSHEGLGLGFYESTSRATPVLSLDGAPHNEVVREGATGWLIPAAPMPVPDNGRSVVNAWRFKTEDLSARIASLRRDEVDRMIESTAQVFRTSLDEIALLTRFIQVLPTARVGAAPAPQAIAAPAHASDVAAPVPPTPAPLPAPAAHAGMGLAARVKLGIKRAAYLTLRRIDQAGAPLSRRLGNRMRILVGEPISALRNDLGARLDRDHNQSRQVLDGTRQLLGEMQALAASVHAQQGQIDSALTQMRSVALEREAPQGLGEGLHALQQQMQALQRQMQMLSAISHDTRHIKERMASYAGPGAVLTYLRDESPIFVNTGDLGCPSPIINGGVWEPDNLAVLMSFVRDDTVFLDIGANVGYFALSIGNRVGRAGKVFAFEPHPALANLIARSVHLNSLEPLLEVHQCALSDQNGTLDLYYPEGHLGQGSHLRNAERPGTHVAVASHKLDSLLPAAVVPDLVKIDVEGHELAVLRGMHDVIARSPKIKILFEKLERDNADTRAIGALLSSFGLALYGVGAGAVLQPLAADAYLDWVGDVLAAPAAEVATLTRTGCAIYPGQLHGQYALQGQVARFARPDGGLAFFGPDWFLAAGQWQLRVHGVLRGGLRLVLADGEMLIAELALEDENLAAGFFLPAAAAHFEMRAYAAAGSVLELECISLQRA